MVNITAVTNVAGSAIARFVALITPALGIVFIFRLIVVIRAVITRVKGCLVHRNSYKCCTPF